MVDNNGGPLSSNSVLMRGFDEIKTMAKSVLRQVSDFVGVIGSSLNAQSKLSDHKVTPQTPQEALEGRVKLAKGVIKSELETIKLFKDHSDSLEAKGVLTSESRRSTEEENKVLFYKTCGCDISYTNWSNGEEIPHADYKVESTITNQQGLKVVVLIPLNEGDPPILCIRGTVSKENVLDDLNLDGIGQLSFKPSMDDLKLKIKDLANRFGPVVVTGHSLGGAVAQLITAHFADETVKKGETEQCVIKETYHFNAPGVGKATARMYLKKSQIVEQKGIKRPIVYSVRHRDDLVYHAGGKHIQADERVKLDHGSGVNFLTAHSASTADGNLNIEKGAGVRLTHRVFSLIGEGLRIGIVGRIANLALIALTPNEDTVEKTKMVAEAALQLIPLYGYWRK